MPNLSDKDVRAIFGMKPEDAIAYVKQKGYQVSWNWYEVRDAAHAQAFTVAKAARLDVLQDIRGALESSLEKGASLSSFKKNLIPTLQAKGWWGKQIIVDGQGEAEVAQLGSPRRLDTIFRTNMQSALMAGRYKQMLANVRFRPYWMYVAVMDGRTRPSHAALNGRVFRWDDPIWETLYPPNGYNCRCRVVALSERDMERRSLVPSSSEGLLVTRDIEVGIDPRTGEIFNTQVTGIKVVANGRPTVFYPDAGFSYNAGKAGLEQAALILARKVEFSDAALGAQAMQAAMRLVMPQLAAEYRTWADTVLRNRQASNTYRVVAALTPEIVTHLKALGQAPQTAAVTLRDSELLHLTRDTKAGRGAMISEQALLDLPQRMANAEAVLWDAQDEAVIYVFPDGTVSQRAKVIVRVDYAQRTRDADGRQKMPRNVVRTAGLVPADDLVKGGRYQVLAGKLE